MVCGRYFYHRSMVSRGRSMVNRCWSMICRSGFDYRGMVGWCRLVVDSGGWEHRSVVGGGRCMVGGGVIHWGRCMVSRCFIREGGRCKVCNGGLLAVAIAMDALGGGVGLADDTGVHCPVRLVHAVAD